MDGKTVHLLFFLFFLFLFLEKDFICVLMSNVRGNESPYFRHQRETYREYNEEDGEKSYEREEHPFIYRSEGVRTAKRRKRKRGRRGVRGRGEREE